jgi:hypothetical protein
MTIRFLIDRPAIILALALAIFGCSRSPPKYQIIETGDGAVVKLNTESGQAWVAYRMTGEVWYWREVTELPKPQARETPAPSPSPSN